MAFMTHPIHGATHTMDVEGHEKLGWKVSTYEEWLGPKAHKPATESSEPVKNKGGMPRKIQ